MKGFEGDRKCVIEVTIVVGVKRGLFLLLDIGDVYKSEDIALDADK